MPLGVGAVGDDIRRKIALFASLPVEAVVSAYDVPDIYQVPLVFHEEGVDDFILRALRARGAAARPRRIGRRSRAGPPRPTDWVRIALVGKYVQLEDAYLSVVEALRHAGVHHGCKVEVDWVDSETVSDPEVAQRLAERRTAS